MSDLRSVWNETRIAADDQWTDQELPTTNPLETILPPSYSFDVFNFSTVHNATTGTGNATTIVHVGYQQALTIVVCSLIIFGTILGNSLICSAVAITRKLRTPSNLLIVSLAISDLLVGALDMPFAVMYEVTGSWSIGGVMCDFWTSIDVLFCTASILNICVISIDRYLVITKPFSYAMKRTPLRMLLMIALVWVVSAIISIPPLFGWKETQPVPDQCAVSQNKGYQFFATIGAFYLPLVIMVVIYTRIYLVSFRMTTTNARASGAPSGAGSRPHSTYSNGRPRTLSNTLTDPILTTFQRTSLRNGGSPTTLNGGCNGGRNGHPAWECTTPLTALTPCTPPPPQQQKRRRTNSASLVDAILRLNCRQRAVRGGRGHERKATKTLGVIMGAFVACWLPFFILALIKPFCHNPDACIPHWLNSLFLWLGFANSLLNPIIYARFNREFRTPFKYILQCRCANINSHLRSEDFTEQFGRLQASRHSSLFPPPLSLPTPTPPPLTPTSRQSSILPPPLRNTPPPPASPYLILPKNPQDSLYSTPLSIPRLHSPSPPYPSFHEITSQQSDDKHTSQQNGVRTTISHELSTDIDTRDNDARFISDPASPPPDETSAISSNHLSSSSLSHVNDCDVRLSLLEELAEPVVKYGDVTCTLLDSVRL